jgi:hypothetical protein
LEEARIDTQESMLATHTQEKATAESSGAYNHQAPSFHPIATYASATVGAPSFTDSAVPPPPHLELFVPGPQTTQGDAFAVQHSSCPNATAESLCSAVPPFALSALHYSPYLDVGIPCLHVDSCHQVRCSFRSVTCTDFLEYMHLTK